MLFCQSPALVFHTPSSSTTAVKTLPASQLQPRSHPNTFSPSFPSHRHCLTNSMSAQHSKQPSFFQHPSSTLARPCPPLDPSSVPSLVHTTPPWLQLRPLISKCDRLLRHPTVRPAPGSREQSNPAVSSTCGDHHLKPFQPIGHSCDCP